MKRNLKILTALLALSGSAQALDLNKAADKALESVDVSINDIFNGTAFDKTLNQITGSLTKQVWQSTLKDVLTSVRQTFNAAKGVETVMANPSSASAVSIIAAMKAINDKVDTAYKTPLDETAVKAAWTAVTSGQATLKTILDANIDKTKTTGTTPTGTTTTDTTTTGTPGTASSIVGEKIGASVAAQKNTAQSQAAFQTGLKEAQSKALADLSIDEAAQKLNATNAKRMTTAINTLGTETKSAVSTRATVEALNTAFASMMAQEVYGNEQVQKRLNLMLQQGALTNNQLGDVVRALRKESEDAVVSNAEKLNEQVAAGKSMATTVWNAGKNAAAAASNAANGSDGADKAVTTGTGSTNPTVLPTIPGETTQGSTSTDPATPNASGEVKINVGGPKTTVIPSTTIPATGGSVEIPVGGPKSPTIPSKIPTPTTPSGSPTDPTGDIASNSVGSP